MKRLVIGVLAHVDSGKTTLSEAILYKTGMIGEPGRVDYKNAFLDTDGIERDRGITIFSKQAQIIGDDCELTLLDTPGHTDFKAEAERTLQVLDYAILLVTASDGIEPHSETLWKLLKSHNIPTFIFVNKTDLPNHGKETIMREIRERFSGNAVDFSDGDFFEAAAMCSEELLDEYMSSGKISQNAIADAVGMRKIIPCYFGSALKIEGIEEFVEGLFRYTKEKVYSDSFGAKVFKISEDEKGKRLTHLKVTGGALKVRDSIEKNGQAEKVNEVRIYSGAGFKSVSEVYSGSICAVLGLTKTFAGMGLGKEPDSDNLTSEPVFSYSVKLPDGYDIHKALEIFKKLEEEETRLCVDWIEQKQKINIRIMGKVQLEVLERILFERFGLKVEFEQGSIVYKETIANKVEGVGHYEPLRHYAEVHLLLEPQKRGSGLTFFVNCSDDTVDKNIKNLVLTHLREKTHIGVLTGSPITDMKITLINAKAHKKHTEGGDFREATYRALRQGLMRAKSVLLEPWYSFTLEIPTETTGRAMTDLQMMGAKFDSPLHEGGISVIKGECPIEKMRDYHSEVIAYTKGRGRILAEFKGYDECTDADRVIGEIGYDYETDLENTPDSVFCTHGSGFVVKWDKVFDYMHLPETQLEPKPISTPINREVCRKIIADDTELLKIFEQTYGKVKQRSYQALKTVKETQKVQKPKEIKKLPKYLLVDGYNIIFAWDTLKALSEESLDDARSLLISKLSTYRAMRKIKIIVVFDAYRVKGDKREVENINGISVVYTKEAETADTYIERATHELSKDYRVSVATSDGHEQMIIFGEGAIRVTPRELMEEIEICEQEIRDFIKQNNTSTHNL